jgi:hypothetical protein
MKIGKDRQSINHDTSEAKERGNERQSSNPDTPEAKENLGHAARLWKR